MKTPIVTSVQELEPAICSGWEEFLRTQHRSRCHLRGHLQLNFDQNQVYTFLKPFQSESFGSSSLPEVLRAETYGCSGSYPCQVRAQTWVASSTNIIGLF